MGVSIEQIIGRKVKNLMRRVGDIECTEESLGAAMISIVEESMNHILIKGMAELSAEAAAGGDDRSFQERMLDVD